MSLTNVRRAAIALALIATAGCTVKDTQPPPLTGPSGLALTLNVNAIPDSISQDGGSQSSVKVTAIGPDGKPVNALALRLDMFVNGVPQDYGTLSARSVVTNSDGVATAVYTAPPSPVNGLFGTCSGLPGNCVSIVATATSTNFVTANPEQVQIRLVPIGVILPPASSPTAAFSFSPQPAAANVPVLFDASSSKAGGGASQIVSYSWTFGDGSTGTGKTPSHTYANQGSYNVTLTVTNDRTLSASTTQALSVAAGALPTPVFTFSPQSPVGINATVFFDASTSAAGTGHSIASYRWTFGDGATASGVTASHAYAVAGLYIVQLTITDEAGQASTSPGTSLTVGSVAGGLFASFTFSPTGPVPGTVVNFNGSASTGGVVRFDWDFGDGTTDTKSAPTTAHAYLVPGTYIVRLTVTDAAGRTNFTTSPVTVTVLPVPPPPAAPVAAFTFSPPSPAVTGGTNTVIFDGSISSTPGGSAITNYRWNFGDGTIISGAPAGAAPAPGGTFQVPRHTYLAGGSFTVTLTVTDGNGLSGTTTGTVTVAP